MKARYFKHTKTKKCRKVRCGKGSCCLY